MEPQRASAGSAVGYLCCEEEEEGMQDWKRRSICSEGNKSERFTVFARPPNRLAPFQELPRMIYKEAELSACPNFHHFLEIKIKSSPTNNKNSRKRLSSQAKGKDK